MRPFPSGTEEWTGALIVALLLGAGVLILSLADWWRTRKRGRQRRLGSRRVLRSWEDFE